MRVRHRISDRACLVVDDCIDAMRRLPAASVDAIVTDPPYALEFMGMTWDCPAAMSGHNPTNTHGPAGGLRFGPGANDEGYRNMRDKMVLFQEWSTVWARAAFRVLKPGGHLLAFGGTRTFHRLACALEEAGFEIRDQITWLYASGFPKSLDVQRAIKQTVSKSATAGFQPLDRTGWGTALKPAHELICVSRKPLAGPTVASNVLTHGTGAINIDGCRIPGVEQRGPGRWPANVVLSHGPGCRPTGERKLRGDAREGGTGRRDAGFFDVGSASGSRRPAGPLYGDPDGTETVASWDCGDGCPVAELDRQGGVRRSGFMRVDTKRSTDGGFTGGFPADRIGAQDTIGDTGAASRFFFVAKPSPSERNLGLEAMPQRIADPHAQHRGRRMATAAGIDGSPAGRRGNFHPTVKPVELMRHLCRLVTPPGGLVLDPFAGSGTTGMAAAMEGFRFIGIERDADYAEIAKRRILHAMQQTPPSNGRERPKPTRRKAA